MHLLLLWLLYPIFPSKFLLPPRSSILPTKVAQSTLKKNHRGEALKGTGGSKERGVHGAVEFVFLRIYDVLSVRCVRVWRGRSGGGEYRWIKLNFPPKIFIQIGGCGSMASKVILDNISVKNNPALFQDSIELDITFTALEAIPSLLEWRVIYVGSAKNEEYDQVLEEFEIGPIPEESTMKFTVECTAPDFTRIPRDELICVTAIIITISYRNQEFIRVGYYVHNVLNDTLPEEERAAADPATLIAHTRRTILTDKPRITKFKINWGDNSLPHHEQSLAMKPEAPYNSNNSLLANKMRMAEQENEEKLSTREEKDQNSHSLMKSEPNPLQEASREVEQSA